MVKYTAEEKSQAVLRYFNGKESYWKSEKR